MAGKANPKTHFVVTYKDPAEDKIVALKARRIGDSSLGLAFIRLSDFVFNTDALVIEPEEEALAKRFEHIESLHLSIYTVVSIAEVGADHAGLEFDKDRSNLVVLSGAADAPKKS